MQADNSHFTEHGAWIVVNTQPHRERVAIDHLLRQEFYTYCPLVRKQVRHARRTQIALRPLFPSYLFVRLDADALRWSPILSTIGVRTVVRCGERPSFVPDGFIASLEAREIDGVVVKPESPFRLGQQVKITDGAFDGIVATIVEMDEKDRVVVLMELLNRHVKVKVGVTQIASAM